MRSNSETLQFHQFYRNLCRHFQVNEKKERVPRVTRSYKRGEDYDRFVRDKQATGLVFIAGTKRGGGGAVSS